MPAACKVAISCLNLPAALSFIVAAICVAVPALLSCALYLLMVPGPALYRDSKVRTPSVPASVANRAVRCALLICAVRVRNWPEMSASERMSPAWSMNEMPAALAASACLAVGLMSWMREVLSEVPASEPFTPDLASAVSAVIVSLNDSPADRAAAPVCTRAMPKSPTSAVVTLAAVAIASDTIPACLPDRLNCAIALAVYEAASPSCRLPALASVSDAAMPPPMICATDRPALPNSVWACATSLAVYPKPCVLADVRMADCLSASICLLVAPVTALTWDICVSKVAADFTARASPPATASVPILAARPI